VIRPVLLAALLASELGCRQPPPTRPAPSAPIRVRAPERPESTPGHTTPPRKKKAEQRLV
jgi:hypothetical protein